MTTKWITKKEKPKSWITKKVKPTKWITKKPTTKSTLMGTDTTRGGGPDEGNVGHNKEMISKHQQYRKQKPEWIKRKKKPEAHTPLRAKHGIGSIVKKVISKIKPKPGVFKPKPKPGKVDQRFLDFIKTGKLVDKQGVKVNVPKVAERLTGKPHVDHGIRKRNTESKKVFKSAKGKAAGGRIGLSHGGSVGAAIRGRGAEIK